MSVYTMPGGTVLEPISSVLKQAFQASSLDQNVLSSTKKTLLSKTPVAFDAPVRQLAALKTKGFILLNGSDPATQVKVKVKTEPPKPRVVFFPLDQITVGYSNMRVAGAGMFNMGNTCYLNSTLQALFHTPAFFNYLMSDNHARDCKGMGCIICSMTATLKDTLRTHVTRPNR